MIISRLPYDNGPNHGIAQATVTFPSFTYNGNQQSLLTNLVVKIDGETLVYGTDYIVTGTTTATNAGTYSASIQGTGIYYGTKSVSWSIAKKSIAAATSGAVWTIKVNNQTISPSSGTTYKATGLPMSTNIPVYLEIVADGLPGGEIVSGITLTQQWTGIFNFVDSSYVPGHQYKSRWQAYTLKMETTDRMSSYYPVRTLTGICWESANYIGSEKLRLEFYPA